MSKDHYIVCLRDGAWQHTNRGSVSAPFASREAAIASAIEEARESKNPQAVVIVQDPEMSTEEVWRSGLDDEAESAKGS